jgi:hypothetical protein
MMKKNITMKVLMETMKKLEKEANYKNFLPDPKKKNFVMSVDKLAAMAAADERDSEEPLDNMYADSEKEKTANAPTNPMRKAPTASLGDDYDDFTTAGASRLKKALENLDFGDDTQTMVYDLEDTKEDEPYDTTEMVGFVDAAADALAASLTNDMPSFHNLSDDEMEKKLKDELMSVLKDMDATDLYDRS